MRLIRPLIVVVMILMAVAPLAFVAAAVLSPLWAWIEASTGLESIGHSGPASWCYLATWAAVSASAVLLWRAGVRGRRAATTSRPGEAPHPRR
jgi:hypothetical protein